MAAGSLEIDGACEVAEIVSAAVPLVGPPQRMPMSPTLRDLLSAGADASPALSAPGRQPLSHGELRALIERTLGQLNALGIGRNDRVAIVLNNGPEMAACFMACASGVTSAPLNPAYRADEFEFYLSDLNAKALIVEQGSSSPAIEVAALGETATPLILQQPRQDYRGPFHFTVRVQDERGTFHLERKVDFLGPDARLLREEEDDEKEYEEGEEEDGEEEEAAKNMKSSVSVSSNSSVDGECVTMLKRKRTKKR